MQYQPYTKTVYLTSDDGAHWDSGSVPFVGAPSPKVLSNSQCTLDLAGATAVRSSNGAAITVTIPVAFSSAYAGVRGLWLVPYEGSHTWYYFNTDTLQANSVTVSPAMVSLNSGLPQQFTANVTGQSNTAVDWTMSPQVGTLSSSGQYSAPSSIASAQVVTDGHQPGGPNEVCHGQGDSDSGHPGGSAPDEPDAVLGQPHVSGYEFDHGGHQRAGGGRGERYVPGGELYHFEPRF